MLQRLHSHNFTRRLLFIAIPCLAALLFNNSPVSAQQYDFVFQIKTVLEKDSEKYVVEKKDVAIFKEEFDQKLSYWGIASGESSGQMTFRFDFEKPVEFGRIKGNLVGANFKLNGAAGVGTGSASLWYSTDGKDWKLLEDQPVPEKILVAGNTFIRLLPDDLQGKKSLWLQVRFLSDVNQKKSYSVAQFCRNDAGDPESMVFDLRVKYRK
jgi:hypothetical protein